MNCRGLYEHVISLAVGSIENGEMIIFTDQDKLFHLLDAVKIQLGYMPIFFIFLTKCN